MLIIDIETSGLNPFKDEILIITIYDGVQYRLYYGDNLDSGLSFLKENETACFLGHNVKFDLTFLIRKGINLTNVEDTFLMSKLIYNGTDYNCSLFNLLKEELNIVLENKKNLQRSFIGVKRVNEEQLSYAIEDVRYLLLLKEHLWNKLVSYDLVPAYELERKLLPVLVKMEMRGIKIDKGGFSNLIESWKREHHSIIKELDKELTRLGFLRKRTYEVRDLFGGIKEIHEGAINYNSRDSLKKLYEQIDGYKGDSFDYESLTKYVIEGRGRLVRFSELLIRYRELSKLLSSYGESFFGKYTDRMRTQYQQVFTTSARISSSGPNLQNIPSDEKVRSCFIADDGCVLITCDMSSAEVRIAADYSRDELLLRSITEGLDMHSMLATDTIRIMTGRGDIVIENKDEKIHINNVWINKKEFRTTHKAVVFGFFYMAGPKKIGDVLLKYFKLFNIEDIEGTCYKIHASLERKLTKLTSFLKSMIDRANKKRRIGNEYLCYLRGIGNHIRIFPERAYADAANYIIQNANAVAMKRALIWLDERLRPYEGEILLTIHDEVVVQCKEGLQEEVRAIVEQTMAEALASVFIYNTPTGVEIKISKTWKK